MAPQKKTAAAKKPAAKTSVVKKKTVVKKKATAKAKPAPKPIKKRLTLDSLTEVEETAPVIEVEKAPSESVKKATKAAKADDVVMRPVQTTGSAIAGRATRKHVTNFMRQLIMLLEAGTPILKTLKTLSKRGKSAAARGLIADIAEFVEQGNPLWQAFDRHPKYFNTIEVNLIKASEAGGTLTTVLNRIADQRESHALLAKRVRGAMIYPAMLLLVCFGVMIILTKWVVPEFKAIFDQIGVDLKGFTSTFITISDFCGDFWPVPPIVIIVLLLVYKGWYVRNPLRRITADRLKLKIPILGPILQDKALAELTQTLAMLLRSGVSMMASLDLTRNAITNRAIAETLQGVRDSIEQGGGFEKPLRAVPDLIPPEITDMLVTGEESGRVDAIAEHIAKTKDEEVKIAVSTLGETLQPVFTLGVGLMVILLFIALFQPMIGLMEAVQG